MNAGATITTGAPPGDLAHSLTERYCLYVVDRRERVRRGRIRHVPWPLRDADLLELDDHLIAAAGIDLAGAAPHPLRLHADALDVHAWPLARA